MDKPVIFLAFANNRDDYLPMINRERKNIYRSLRWFHDNGIIKVEKEATTQLEDIFEVFSENDNQITIFHFGGHAGGMHLQLEQANSDTEKAHMEGLALLLGQQKNLQLVFLNGCATLPQVELLLKNGVKAVIATSASVQDKMATEFAELFYNYLTGHSSIERAFQMAKAFIASRYSNFQPIQIYRDIAPQSIEHKEAFPWGLYLSKRAEDALEWTLPFPETTYEHSNAKNLLNQIPFSSIEFVGYEKELEVFQEALLNTPLIMLEGLGGSGKTEFALEGIKRFIANRERVIWVGPTTHFDAMIQQIGYEDILRMDNQAEHFKFKNLEGLLDRDNRIVFIEDLYDNEDETFLRFFNQLGQSKARVVILSRFIPEGLQPGVVIRLNGLGEAAITHARNLKNRNKAYEEIPDQELETLCQLTEGHPLSLEMGMQLLGYGESASTILETISGGDYTEHRKVEELSQSLFAKVLNHDNTSPKERELLMKFSVFRDRVPLEAIEALFDNVRIKYPLSQLIEKSLIRLRNKRYDTLPLIREFCLIHLEDKEEVHELAADYFLDQRGLDFDILLEENIIYHLSKSNQWELLGANIKRNGRFFIAHGQTKLLNQIINRLNQENIEQPIFYLFQAEILRFNGENKKALQPATKALEAYRAFSDLSGVAHALNILGQIHHWLSHSEKAKAAYEEALEIALQVNIPHISIDSYRYLASISMNQGHINEAMYFVQLGLVLAKQTGDQFGLASLLNVQGKVFWLQKAFDKALETRRKSFNIYSEIGARVYMVVVLNNIAVTMLTQGQYEDALVELKKALDIEKKIGAKYRIGNLYNNIGKALLGMNKQVEALEKFQESLDIHKAIKYDLGCAAGHHAIGTCFLQMNRPSEALESYKTSLTICEKIGYNLGRLNLLKAIGNTYLQFEEKDMDSALNYILQALLLDEKIDKKDQEIYEQLLMLHDSIGMEEFKLKVEHLSASWLQEDKEVLSKYLKKNGG